MIAKPTHVVRQNQPAVLLAPAEDAVLVKKKLTLVNLLAEHLTRKLAHAQVARVVLPAPLVALALKFKNAAPLAQVVFGVVTLIASVLLQAEALVAPAQALVDVAS